MRSHLCNEVWILEIFLVHHVTRFSFHYSQVRTTDSLVIFWHFHLNFLSTREKSAQSHPPSSSPWKVFPLKVFVICVKSGKRCSHRIFFLLSVRLSSSTPCYLWRIWLADSPSQNKAWSSLKRLNHTALMSLLSFRFNKTNLRYRNYKKMISSSINLFNNRFLTPNTTFCREDCCFLAI